MSETDLYYLISRNDIPDGWNPLQTSHIVGSDKAMQRC